MKAIEILNKLIKAEHWEDYYPSKNDCNDAIKEIERLKEYKKLLYNYNIEVYRCKCGTLARKGYLCSNKECTEEDIN